jgi:hypothetical protein
MAQLNAGESQSLAKPLGEVLADISCEVIDQVFGDLARLSTSGDGESEKVIQHIVDTMRKYMPWSVSFFSNVCHMGGGVRCMSWQVRGKNAELFLNYLNKISK